MRVNCNASFHDFSYFIKYLRDDSLMRSDLNRCAISLNNKKAGLSLEPFPIWKKHSLNYWCEEHENVKRHLLDRIWYPISFRCRSFSIISLCPVVNPWMPANEKKTRAKSIKRINHFIRIAFAAHRLITFLVHRDTWVLSQWHLIFLRMLEWFSVTWECRRLKQSMKCFILVLAVSLCGIFLFKVRCFLNLIQDILLSIVSVCQT